MIPVFVAKDTLVSLSSGFWASYILIIAFLWFSSSTLFSDVPPFPFPIFISGCARIQCQQDPIPFHGNPFCPGSDFFPKLIVPYPPSQLDVTWWPAFFPPHETRERFFSPPLFFFVAKIFPPCGWQFPRRTLVLDPMKPRGSFGPFPLILELTSWFSVFP